MGSDFKSVNELFGWFEAAGHADLAKRFAKIVDIEGIVWREVCRATDVLFSVQFAERFGGFCDYWELSKNLAFLSKLDSVAVLQDQLDWALVTEILCREGEQWLEPYLTRFPGRLNPRVLTQFRSATWSAQEVRKWPERVDFRVLSCSCVERPWDQALLDEFEAKVDWSEMSANRFVLWSVPLLGRYQKRWDWKRLSLNADLPWSRELVAKFEAQWDWGSWMEIPEDRGPATQIACGLSSLEVLPWSKEFFLAFESRWNLSVLRQNPKALAVLLREGVKLGAGD